MPNGNPFYVQPGGAWGPGLQGLSQSLGQYGQLREQRLNKTKMEEMKRGAAEAFASGDPDTIADFSISNPEMAQTLMGASKFRNERTKENYINSVFSAIQNPDQIPNIAAQRVEFLQSQGLDPKEMQNTMNVVQRYEQDPEGTVESMKNELAFMAPDRWKAYQKATGGIDDTRYQKTSSYIAKDPETGETAVVAGVFNPKDGSLKTASATIPGYQLVSKLGETGIEETERKITQKRGEVAVKGEEERASDLITRGIAAADSTATIRRALDLLDTVKTGGLNNALLRAKQLFGVEAADEGELSNTLGKSVLSQLKETFGAAFTVEEGQRLERIEAGFGKSPATNKRLLNKALRIAERTAKRAMKEAKKRGDSETVEDINEMLEFSLTGEEVEPYQRPGETQIDEMSQEDLFKTAFPKSVGRK